MIFEKISQKKNITYGYFSFFGGSIIGYFWAKKAEMQRNQGSEFWDF